MCLRCLDNQAYTMEMKWLLVTESLVANSPAHSVHTIISQTLTTMSIGCDSESHNPIDEYYCITMVSNSHVKICDPKMNDNQVDTENDTKKYC